MPALGKKERVRLSELRETIAMMESRKLIESQDVIDLLDKNINYCKTKLNEIIIEMLNKGYQGEDL